MKLGETVTDHPLFYIVLIGLVIIVYAQVFFKKKDRTTASSQSLEEFERTVEMFASDLEEQNEALMQLLAETKRDYELQLTRQLGRIEALEKQFQEAALEIAHLKLLLNERVSEVQTAATMVAGRSASEVADNPAPAVADNPAPAVADSSAPAVQLETVHNDAHSDSVKPVTIRSRYEELFALYESGKSIEYIAKQLGMNKGEISLILMLSKQEEAEA